MAGGWGCPHEVKDRCTKINNLPCDPGMKGCELYGRFRFADESKNVRYWEKKAREPQSAALSDATPATGKDEPPVSE
ncbi:MAG: hypothetical protein ACM3X0_05225 [Bacteroidota bacterium]